ncbi:FtsX-like permease family protein [Patescibacteria group bacterium]|nr:MAG: FtsX-like permease family protein [Patescibacteria group bacterium]
MHYGNSMHCSWKTLAANKARSFLSMLGVIIGVMVVIIIISVGAGAQSLILNQIKSLGSNLVGVLPGQSEEKGPPVAALGVVITTLKYEDGKAIAQSGNPHIIGVASYVRGIDTVVVGDKKTDTNFLGTTASYINVEDANVETGRFFTEEEERAMGRVAALGSQVAQDLFGNDDPLGKQIKIKRTPFTIIGVMKARGVSGFQNQDNQIFVPLPAAQKLLLGINHVSFMRVKVDSGEYVDSAMDFVKQILRAEHGITNAADDDFTVRSATDGLAALTQITNALRFFLAAVASIALVVGGFGIMNIMLAAVTERTREIGLRKAVGARHSDITRQFLVETVTITLSGGIIGALFGILLSVIAATVAQNLGYKWDLVVTFSSVLFAGAVSVAIGLIFGIVPARRASRLNPIEALRYE